MWKARGRLDVQREEEGSRSMSSHKTSHTVPVASTAARQPGRQPGSSWAFCECECVGCWVSRYYY